MKFKMILKFSIQQSKKNSKTLKSIPGFHKDPQVFELPFTKFTKIRQKYHLRIRFNKGNSTKAKS